MWKTIDRIRRKPKTVRNRYAFLISATITSLIALVWLVSMWAKFNNQTAPATENSTTSPFSELKDKFGDFRGLIGESLNSADDGGDNGFATGSDTLSEIIEEIVSDYNLQGSTSEVGVIGSEPQSEVTGDVMPLPDTGLSVGVVGASPSPGVVDSSDVLLPPLPNPNTQTDKSDLDTEPKVEIPPETPTKIVRPVIVTPSNTEDETGTSTEIEQ